MIKQFVPCIYLYHEKAVTSLTDTTVVDTDPVRLAKYYCENHADGLIVFDMSEIQPGDTEKEAAWDLIKEICSTAWVDVIGAGSIERLEDVKKLLYAGCKKVILDGEKESNLVLVKEASLRFGQEKLLLSCQEAAAIENSLEGYLSGLVLMNPHIIREAQALTELPLTVQINQVALNKLMEILTLESVCAITGNTINRNMPEIPAIKELCRENGLGVTALQENVPWSAFKLNSEGLLPVVVQDWRTQEVLMVAYMNQEAYLQTLASGKMTYFSRSRKQLWLKGESSGNFQYVKSLTGDCDMDTLLAKVAPAGPACHTGARSCFFQKVAGKDYQEASNPLQVFQEVFDVIQDRKGNPKEGSYTNYLFDKGVDKILKKLGEEATEIVIAAKNPNANEIKYEICDFLYHLMVLMAEKGITWEEITEELAKR